MLLIKKHATFPKKVFRNYLEMHKKLRNSSHLMKKYLIAFFFPFFLYVQNLAAFEKGLSDFFGVITANILKRYFCNKIWHLMNHWIIWKVFKIQPNESFEKSVWQSIDIFIWFLIRILYLFLGGIPSHVYDTILESWKDDDLSPSRQGFLLKIFEFSWHGFYE